MTDNALKKSPDRRAWIGLTVVLGPVLLVSMDGSVLYLAMPHIASALVPTADQSLWILDVYGYVVGSLLIAFGAVGDKFGRLKLITTGAALFGIGSLGAAFSPTPTALIGFRALMGLGGATLLPSGLAIVSSLFADPRQRAQAIGIFAATFATGFAVGPMIGGFLLRFFPWGAVFLINLPVVLLFLLATPILLRPILLRPNPSPQDDATRCVGVDLLSLVLSFSGLLLFIYAIKTAAAYGASWTSFFYGVAGLAVLGWFIVRQNAISYPLLDLSLFKDRVFSFAISTGLLSLVVWSAVGYLGSLYLQAVLGFDIFTTALLTLPGAAVITTTCILTSRIVETIGRKAALIATYLFIGSGVGLLLFVTQEQGAILYVASTVVAGVGYGLSFSLVAEVAVSAVPPERAGAASAIAETSNELGNALGISLLGSLAALLFRLLGPGVAATLSETLQKPELSAEILALAKHAQVAGLHAAMGAAAAVMLTIGLSACFWLKADELAAARAPAPETRPKLRPQHHP